MGALERQAVRRVVDELHAAGVTLPPQLDRAVHAVLGERGSVGARLWTEAHPDEADWPPPCCWGSLDGPDGCTCWQPVYEVEQARPRPPAGQQDLQVRPAMCDDCAFRPRSQERTDPLMGEELLSLPERREPFWCHDGMRRPVRWEHPSGRTIAGAPDDWHPTVQWHIPYRADGSPALLCAGWAALATRDLSEAAGA